MQSKNVRASVLQKLVDEGVREKLEQMALDNSLNTLSSYSPNVQEYPDNRMSFVDRHIEYLLNHPKLDSRQYLANLRMKVKKR